MTKDEALNGLKHLETIAEQLKTYSDQGQYLNIPSHLSAGNCWWMAKEIENVINACKEALEQPAQEPVAWKVISYSGSAGAPYITEKQPYVTNAKIIPLYTHPHQWQGLTDDEIEKVFQNIETSTTHRKIYCAIEAKLKEKNI